MSEGESGMAIKHDTAFRMVELHESSQDEEVERKLVVSLIVTFCNPPDPNPESLISHITPVSTWELFRRLHWAQQLPSTLANVNSTVVATSHSLHTPIFI